MRLRFFIYYVFWPASFMAGLVYCQLMAPEWTWWFSVPWAFAWLIWPIGTARTRLLTPLVEDAKARMGLDTGAAGEALVLLVGPILIMLLSGLVGISLTPIYMEEVLGINMEVKFEEVRERVKEGDRYLSSP